MTAEIAIMNKSAVALAADSAVTIGNKKIFNTVNKVFTLSKYYPVGVMIYGKAEMMGVPWETIVKFYRARIGSRNFPHLEDFAEDFLKFLRSSRQISPAADQAEYFETLVAAFYKCITVHTQQRVSEHIAKNGKITIAETKQIVQSEIERHHAELKAIRTLPGFSQQFANRLLKKHEKRVKRAYQHFFQKLPVSSSIRRKLLDCSGWIFVRDYFRIPNSGLVIAGFGERDIYPRLTEFGIEGIVENKMRFQRRRSVRIGIDNGASIVPFAQSEVVSGFMEGIDPFLEEVLQKSLNKIFADYPALVLKHVPGLTAKAKQGVERQTKAASEAVLRAFQTKFKEFRRIRLIDPIVDAVAVLPKDELAAMAEALVSLTSFKRRFSMDAETVGGPIDVAILSKGDGFIWIKRKHYFKPELNPHFVANYFPVNQFV